MNLSTAFRKHTKSGIKKVGAGHTAIKFENFTKGTAGWLLYDVDESSLGLSILYNW